MSKAIYIVAALALTFASADATGSRKSGDRIQIVYREQSSGQWQAYVFGTSCAGTMHMTQPTDPEQPVVIACRP